MHVSVQEKQQVFCQVGSVAALVRNKSDNFLMATHQHESSAGLSAHAAASSRVGTAAARFPAGREQSAVKPPRPGEEAVVSTRQGGWLDGMHANVQENGLTLPLNMYFFSRYGHPTFSELGIFFGSAQMSTMCGPPV